MTAPMARRGFTDEAVAELVKRRDEPEWMRERRLRAWKIYQQLPMPTRQDEEWRRTEPAGLHLDDVDLAPPGGSRRVALVSFPQPSAARLSADSWASTTAGRSSIGLPRICAPGCHLHRSGYRRREHGDLLRQYFMTRCVPPGDSKFAALHGAFWDNGTFLYVPRGVAVEQPLRTIVAATLDGTASLSHTLIVLEEGSQAIFAEDFTSPPAGARGLAVVSSRSF